jgi:Flp pilus assembly protein TadD
VTRARTDRRRAGALLTLFAVFAGGFVFQWPGFEATRLSTESAASSRPLTSATAQPEQRSAEVHRRFDDAVAMLQARDYNGAVTGFQRVLELAPDLPEAHVDMGYALLGLGRAKEALDSFDGATALRPDQANAYYGMALAYEASGDLATATGAMRSYLHLARNESEAHLRRARAALWEWEARRTPR